MIPPKLGRPEAGPSVSAVIPVYNNASTILPLLDSLARQTVPAEEIIVVDDASTDQTASLAEAHPIKAKVVRLAKNSGPALARNRGAEEAWGEVILFLDSDVVVDKRAVAEVKDVFSDPKVTAVNGAMTDKPLNSGWAAWYKCLVEHAWSDFVPEWDDTATCFNARIGAIRKSVFWQAGGFDTRYTRPSMEDHEFGQRLVRRHKIILDKDLKASHHFGGLAETSRNYWKRTQEFLEMLWTTPGAAADRGGASAGSASEFVCGTALVISLAASPWTGWWLPLILLAAFTALSWKSLKYCLKRKGPTFYLFSLGLHAYYGLIVTASGLVAAWRYKIKPRLSG